MLMLGLTKQMKLRIFFVYSFRSETHIGCSAELRRVKDPEDAGSCTKIGTAESPHLVPNKHSH